MALKTLTEDHFRVLLWADTQGSLTITKKHGRAWPGELFLAEAMASLYFLSCVRRWKSEHKDHAEFIITESGRVVLSLRPTCCVPETVLPARCPHGYVVGAAPDETNCPKCVDRSNLDAQLRDPHP